MIDVNDRIDLPRDVCFSGDALVDLALDEAYPLRGSATLGMALLAAGLTVRDASLELARRHEQDATSVLIDLTAFVAQLSRADLVNLRPSSWGSRLRRALHVLTFLIVTHRWPPGRVRRYPLVGASAAAAVRQIAAVVAFRMAPVWIIAGLPLLLPLAWLAPSLMPASGALLVGLVIATILHEAAHALTARWLGIGSFLIRSGWRVAVLHARASSGGLVPAMGPLSCGALGLALSISAAMLHSITLAFTAIPFVIQLLSLSVFAQDGRHLVAGRGGQT
jgi:hypothetical protein